MVAQRFPADRLWAPALQVCLCLSRCIALLCSLVILAQGCDSPCSDRLVDIQDPIDMTELVLETDAGEVLWRLSGSGEPLRIIRYGEVPGSARQTFPATGLQPRRLASKERLTVKVYSKTEFFFIHGSGQANGGFCGGAYEAGPLSSLSKHQESLGRGTTTRNQNR